MFEEVNKIAIIAILKSIDKDILIKNLAEYLINVTSDDPLRIAAILVNKLPIPKIPQYSKVCGRKGTFKEYNHYHGTIEYQYDDVEVLYFATEEDANRYCDTGEKDDYSYTKSGKYQYEGKRTCEGISYCRIETWLENAIKDNNNEKKSD